MLLFFFFLVASEFGYSTANPCEPCKHLIRITMEYFMYLKEKLILVMVFFIYIYLIYSTLLQTLKGNVTIIRVCVMVFLENLRFIIYNFK